MVNINKNTDKKRKENHVTCENMMMRQTESWGPENKFRNR